MFIFVIKINFIIHLTLKIQNCNYLWKMNLILPKFKEFTSCKKYKVWTFDKLLEKHLKKKIPLFCFTGTEFDIEFGQNKILENHLLVQAKVRSILECAAICQIESKCLSFDYKAIGKRCFLNRVIGSLTSGYLTADMT